MPSSAADNNKTSRQSGGAVAWLRRWGPMLYRERKTGAPFSFSPLTYFPAGWVALSAITLIDAVSIPFERWIHLPSALWVAFCSLPFVFTLRILLVGAGMMEMPELNRMLRHSKKIYMIAEFLALASGTSSAMCLLSYLAATSPLPLIDTQLNAFDRILGFDWSYWYGVSRGAFHRMFDFAYDSVQSQVLVFTVVFTLRSRKDRLYEIYWDLYVAVLLTIGASAIWPSLGPASIYWTPDQLKHIGHIFGYGIPDVTAIRAHTAPDFKSHDPTGIINFPSFHTVCALIFLYAFRGTGWIFGLAAIANIAMLVSIPVRGDHYIADVAGGVAVTVVSILIVKAIVDWLPKTKRPQAS